MTAATLTFACGAALQQLAANDIPVLPRRIAPHRALAETTPVAVTLTRNWKKIRIEALVDEVTSDPRLWLEMHFDDWDRLRTDVRRRGLSRMQARFDDVIAGPDAWSTMTAQDWDAIPQPIRLVAVPQLIEYWVNAYALGHAFELPTQLMIDTVSAIVMAESWFEHRAHVVNQWGNRDMGLGQCSNRCRRDLDRLAQEGLLGFRLAEDDHFNPWHATRVAVVWFGLELTRAEGDVDTAIRAYHRGFKAACRGEGGEYLKNVRRLRNKYFGPEPERSTTWVALAQWASRG